ncbi:hypothetical protein [Nocardia gipuzkoensis]|uniref:hypothetical protein n=1 Tax=Nocardia gipuzkoensis TaxID=2749991 RepID=UPI003EDFD81A
MSDHNAEGHRTRRRAVRSAGPPVEETATTTDAKTSAAVATAARGAGTSGSPMDSGSSSIGADPSTSLAKPPSQDTPGSVARSADVAETSVAKAKSDAAPDADKSDQAAVATAGTEVEQDTTEADQDVVAAGGAQVQRGIDKPDHAAVAGEEGAEAAETSLAKGNAENSAEADQTAVAAAGADAEQDTDEDSPTEKEAAQTRNRRVARILALAASALLVLALVCGATVSVFAMRSAHERDERRAEYLQTARQAIVNLTTIRADSAKQDIDRILALASGEFKTEFDGRVDPFTSIVQQAKVVSSGEIVEAALESDDDRSARVLVAAKQTLTNAGQAEPQTRYYRFRVTVSRGDSGLTVSDVEFVA